MKYLFMNDINYIITNKKKILLLYYIAILCISVIYASSGTNLGNSISIILGNNYKKTESLYIELIMYIFNIAIAVYICFTIYIKDIRYQLDNIFLRISPNKWILKKNIVFLIIMALFKIIEYACVVLVFVLFNNNNNSNNLFLLIFKDYLYHLVIQYFCLFVYITFCIFNRIKILFIILSIVLIYLFPQNIMHCNSLLLILSLISLVLFIRILFINQSKTIIQKVGKI